jgi:hypothetical protein
MRRSVRRKRQPGTPKTMSIAEAGWEFYGLGEAASYAAAARGEIPYIQVGGLKRVPIQLMEQKLLQVERAVNSDAATAEPAALSAAPK